MNTETLLAIKAENTTHFSITKGEYVTYAGMSIATCEKLQYGEIEIK